MKTCRTLLLLLLLAGLGGCASPTQKARNDASNLDWDSRVGTYAYSEAKTEFGNPEYLEESSSGRVAEWIIRRSPQMTFGFGVGGSSYGGGVRSGMGVGTSLTPRPHGEYLRLSFDTDEKLSAWSLVKY